MDTPTNTTHLPDAILTEILARLPLRSICRFKCVCKTWKWTLESPYFRRLFVSVHQNSSPAWSLLISFGDLELMGFHGCQTWDLPKSPASFIPVRHRIGDFNFKDASSGLVLIQARCDHVCYVGNPVLQQWVKIPHPPNTWDMLGLVTRLDKDGVVLSFKVFALALVETSDGYDETQTWTLYSSETGIWTSKSIYSGDDSIFCPYITLNGTIYFSYKEDGCLVAHDFYSESDQFRVVLLPDHSTHNTGYERALTTSKGSVMYITAFTQKEETALKVWRLNNDPGDESWQLVWDIGVSIVGSYETMTMHPFDCGIVYLWSRENHHAVSCNLRTQNYKILEDGCNDNDQEFYINRSFCYGSLISMNGAGLFQFVLPRWMEPVPRPPQAEMTDSASLLSYMTSKLETRQRNRENNRFGIR